jgi:hypothetical protein
MRNSFRSERKSFNRPFIYRKPLTTDATLDWLKETEMATRLESAVARVIKEGKVRTSDMGGKDSTLDVAKAIADYAGQRTRLACWFRRHAETSFLFV